MAGQRETGRWKLRGPALPGQGPFYTRLIVKLQMGSRFDHQKEQRVPKFADTIRQLSHSAHAGAFFLGPHLYLWAASGVLRNDPSLRLQRVKQSPASPRRLCRWSPSEFPRAGERLLHPPPPVGAERLRGLQRAHFRRPRSGRRHCL